MANATTTAILRSCETEDIFSLTNYWRFCSTGDAYIRSSGTREKFAVFGCCALDFYISSYMNSEIINLLILSLLFLGYYQLM